MKKASQQERTKTRRRRLPIAKNAPTEPEVALDFKEQAHLLDMSEDAIFLWRHPGGIESWNKGAIELYGYEQDEAIGRVLRELLRTKFPAPWEEIEKELRERGTWRGELVHYAHGGREIIVSTRLQLVSQDSESMLVLESTRDITEIKRDTEELERRAREQSFMARFTLDAIQATGIETLCDSATHILVENMAVDFSAVFQCTSDGKSMLLRSGVGWRPGHVGVTRIDRARQLIQPIIIGDLRRDTRLPQFMREHGVSSHMAVVIPGLAGPFGMLGVETRSPRAFSAHDVHFVESIGNVLATAISRLQFEDKLRDTAERLRGIVDTALDGIITIDEYGVVQTMNPAAGGIFGYPVDEVIGRSVSMLMPEPYHSEHDGYLERYRKTGEPHIIGTRREVRGRRKDGSEFPLDLAITVDKRRIFTGLMRDISERRRLEHEILEISDREQRRIGNDLHDDLCQRLAAIRFSCDALKSSLGNTATDSSNRVDKIATAVSEAIDRARMLAHGLSPVALESNGLVSALQELTDAVQKLFGIECSFESKGKIALTDTMTGTNLYRIAQEAINNALKHGHSSRLAVTLKEVGDKAALTIHDNGAGFSVDGQQSQGVGLRTLSYRAAMIGAALQVESKPGQGTTIVCTFSPNP
jgi:two-component system, LuxR family, sensor kinase FixL